MTRKIALIVLALASLLGCGDSLLLGDALVNSRLARASQGEYPLTKPRITAPTCSTGGVS